MHWYDVKSILNVSVCMSNDILRRTYQFIDQRAFQFQMFLLQLSIVMANVLISV